MEWLGEKNDFEDGAIINFYKPVGKSSFWIVNQIRRTIHCKVGHAGTLDPFAEGVLLICTGKATKKVSELMDLHKVYIGDVGLGMQTNTDDVTGEVVEKKPVPALNQNMIQDILASFIGPIQQLPPMFSAKKVGGKRLYKIARKGQVVERKPSSIVIESIELLKFEDTLLKLKVTCSKGTYIRALARDIGIKMGCGGYLKSLVRTEIGPYTVNDSITLSKFKERVENTETFG